MEEDPFPELPDLPDLPDLPELPDFPGLSKEISCAACNWIEQAVCKPLAKQGDPHQCAVDILDARKRGQGLPDGDRTRLMAEVLEKYGIPPDLPAPPRRG